MAIRHSNLNHKNVQIYDRVLFHCASSGRSWTHSKPVLPVYDCNSQINLLLGTDLLPVRLAELCSAMQEPLNGGRHQPI